MGDTDWLVTEFEANRPRLRGLAYRMLGSRAEADDAVQDAWLRLAGADADDVDNLGGWLTTVVARLCLDRLRSRTSRREDAAGITPAELPADDADPAGQAVMADSIGAALLIVLDSLQPAERVAFVLHDVFAVPFDEIAVIVDKSPDATRQLASRARRRVQGTSGTVDVDPMRQREVVHAFLRAAQSGDFEGLLQVLDPGVVLRPDAAALQMGSMKETVGAREVAGALSGGAKVAKLAVIDGLAGLVWAPGGELRGVIQFTVVDGRISALDVTSDPDRIAALDVVVL